MKNKNKILKEAGVLLIAAVMILSTGAVIADTQEKNVTLAMLNENTDFFVKNLQNPIRGEELIGYYLGIALDGIQISATVTWQGAIRITPEELAPYDGFELRGAQWYQYDEGTYTCILIVYDQGSETAPGSPLYTSPPYTADQSGWHRIDLDQPITLDINRDIWISIKTTSGPDEFPIATDNGPHVYHKGNWVYLNSQWNDPYVEWGLDFNWNIDAIVYAEAPLSADAGGPYEAYVDEDINFQGTATDGTPPYTYLWDFGNGDNSTEEDPVYAYDTVGLYTVNLTVTDAGRAIAYDETTANITEKPLEAELNITAIVGGMGVTATIKNIGETAATNLEWNIQVTGGFLGLVDADVNGNKSSLAVNATEDAASGSLGFLHLGGLEITVTADADNAAKLSKDYTAFIIGPFVLGVGVTIEE